MRCNPRLLLNARRARPKISVILIDWGVRESFHSLHYLNRQSVPRSEYELIWLEFYDREPAGLRRALDDPDWHPVLDKWIVLGYPSDYLFHKHRLYNVGILAAEGDVCVICDSDAIFLPTFIESVIRAFEETPNAVIHLDQVRNDHQRFYPFNYPDVADVITQPGVVNWHYRAETTRGLDRSPDMIHAANYGACMAARRLDLLAVGGADEHLDYLGYICGPYDLTFRLVNYGRTERWLREEYLYHVWHPNQSGVNTDYQGPHDGSYMSLLALDARARWRIQPHKRCPWMPRFRSVRPGDVEWVLSRLADREEPAWRVGNQPTEPPDYVYWVDRDFRGFNVFCHSGRWYALPENAGKFRPRKARRGGYATLLQAETKAELKEEMLAVSAGWETARRQEGRWDRLLRKVRAQPLHHLPGRLVRKSRRLLRSVGAARLPWEKAR
jgi:hypothetical protein